MAKYWKFDGKYVRVGGKYAKCDDCPCGECDESCEHCECIPAQVQITISGVTGCVGRCTNRNITILLPLNTVCGWGDTQVFPATDDDPGDTSPEGCGLLADESIYNSVVNVRITGAGAIEVEIADQITGIVTSSALFTGTFTGDCADLDVTLSSPTTDYVGSMTFVCVECQDADPSGNGWSKWDAVSVRVQAA